jgi:hypothetical protein
LADATGATGRTWCSNSCALCPQSTSRAKETIEPFGSETGRIWRDVFHTSAGRIVRNNNSVNCTYWSQQCHRRQAKHFARNPGCFRPASLLQSVVHLGLLPAIRRSGPSGLICLEHSQHCSVAMPQFEPSAESNAGSRRLTNSSSVPIWSADFPRSRDTLDGSVRKLACDGLRRKNGTPSALN